MAYTQADLESATAKLDACELSAAETEAIADTLKAALIDDDEVSGFQMERPRAGFLIDVTGVMKPAGTNWSWGASQSAVDRPGDDGYILHRKKR